jgi:mono/diheme cytochrome c family protein
MARSRRILLAIPAVCALLLIVGLLSSRRGGLSGSGADQAVVGDAALVERGRYLATAGNCASCHTRPGGAPFAGGVAFETPFGSIYSSNITADPVHGIGNWSAEERRRAPLVASPIVQASDPASLINAILYGAKPPDGIELGAWETMKPYADILSDAEVAAVASYVRGTWGNQASGVDAAKVVKQR